MHKGLFEPAITVPKAPEFEPGEEREPQREQQGDPGHQTSWYGITVQAHRVRCPSIQFELAFLVPSLKFWMLILAKLHAENISPVEWLHNRRVQSAS